MCIYQSEDGILTNDTLGKLSNPGKVVVDIGTGYYVEKDSKAAQDYFNRKVKFVTENMERVQAIGNEKAKIRCVSRKNFEGIKSILLESW